MISVLYLPHHTSSGLSPIFFSSHPLHIKLLILMGFPIPRRRHTCHRLEYPVKMRQIRKPCLLADLRNILIRLHKLPLRIHDPCHIQILNDRTVGIFLKFPAQVIMADIKHLCQHINIDILHIMRMHIAHHLIDAGALEPVNHPPVPDVGLIHPVGIIQHLRQLCRLHPFPLKVQHDPFERNIFRSIRKNASHKEKTASSPPASKYKAHPESADTVLPPL